MKTVDHKRPTRRNSGLGKFEGEPDFVKEYWNAGVDGFADKDTWDEEEGRPVYIFDLTDEDVRRHPDLAGWKQLLLWEDDQGFVYYDLRGRKSMPGRRGRKANPRLSCRRNQTQHGTGHIPDAPYYAIATDRFMSGWGKARQMQNVYVIPCETYEQAEIALDNLQHRPEMKYARIVGTKPRAKPGILFSVARPGHMYFERGAFRRSPRK